MKRAFDLFVSSIILLCFLPFGLLIAVAIFATSKGGIFYRQERIGFHGAPFHVFKFRTMRPNSDTLGELTVGMRDPRITSVGVFLRKFKLDEFPQFLNVLLGQMSIVGPRPEVRKYVDCYTEEQRKVLSVRPGITDYASLEYFHENEILGKAVDPEKAYLEIVMPAKLELNKKYIANPTISADLKIMWLTFMKIVRR